jgi:hypothetical protein
MIDITSLWEQRGTVQTKSSVFKIRPSFPYRMYSFTDSSPAEIWHGTVSAILPISALYHLLPVVIGGARLTAGIASNIEAFHTQQQYTPPMQWSTVMGLCRLSRKACLAHQKPMGPPACVQIG